MRKLRAREWWLGGSALVLALAAACGSTDSARKVNRSQMGDAGAAGGDADSGGAGAGAVPVAGAESGGAAGEPASMVGGGAGLGGGSGNAALAGAGGADAGAGAGGADASGAGAGGAAGAPGCEAADPVSLQGRWLTNCNGYNTVTTIAASGAVATSSTNGQYAWGTLDQAGNITTAGEGGPYTNFTTTGVLTRTACEALHYEYVGQIPAGTGPKTNYACDMTRAPDCAPTLLEALVGTWTSSCGGLTCTSTFTLDGKSTNSCSNGQGSTGTVSEVGVFADQGGGGGFQDYSLTGTLGLQTCDTLLMAYTWQIPPNQGAKNSKNCTYTRQK